MKLSFYFSLLFCSCLALHAMEADEGMSDSPFDTLPAEGVAKILEFAHEPLPIKDGIQDVAELFYDSTSYNSAIDWSPDSECVAIGVGNTVKRLSCNGKLLGEYTHNGAVGSIVWSPDGQYLAFSGEGRVQICTIEGKKLCEWEHRDDEKNLRAIYALSWSPNSMYVASGGDDNKVRIFSRDGMLQSVCRREEDMCGLPGAAPNG
ncbi:hypothetical protein E3J61_00615, partial [Candidatus Dependentiae bacterium]